MTDNISLLSVKDICALTRLSRTFINKLRIEGKFPKPVMLGEKRILWPRHEIDAWLKQRIADRDERAAR